ncbi:16S rRNA (cytosine(1402)-N(4))-methyltransferase RsmH, partial [Patescibacteria group bacterium]|nr:16S rRNA (cytosine(1402)-N(4))-methyltransferase RsmH [Patescibacteria group bacterium]
MGLTVVENRHSPVLKKEVLEFLDVQKNSVIVDCTLGLGGHAEAILEKAGKLIGFDLDEKNLSEATNRLERFEKKLITVHSNFRYLSDELSKLGFDQVDGIFLDLGLSSPHLDEPDRGFSFREKGHLDMRYNRLDGESAYDIVNTASEERLADIIYEYGEERASRKIAKAIVKQRPIKTTTELADIVKSVIRGK